MRSSKGAARYAKALLELAIEQNKLDVIAADMKYLLLVNDENKDFHIVLNSPVINSDKKIEIFGAIFGQFDNLSTMFINLITKNRREYMLPQIAHQFDVQMKAGKGIVPITLISAIALNDTTKKEILEKAQASIKGTLEVTELVDESLIGGFIIRMEDKQIDASVASQINNLKQRLTR